MQEFLWHSISLSVIDLWEYLQKGPWYRITVVEKEKEHIYHSLFFFKDMCNINAEQAYLNILIPISKVVINFCLKKWLKSIFFSYRNKINWLLLFIHEIIEKSGKNDRWGLAPPLSFTSVLGMILRWETPPVCKWRSLWLGRLVHTFSRSLYICCVLQPP